MSDPVKLMAGHSIVFTDAMPISDSFDMQSTLDAYYDPVIECTNEAGAVMDCSIPVQRIPEAAFTRRAVSRYRVTSSFCD